MEELTVVDLANADVIQNGHIVLSNVNMKITKGEFIFLIGQTGSGKSSLLKMMYGDLRITNGTGTSVGFDLKNLKSADVPLLRRKTGIVFQDFQLLTDRTVEENLRFVMEATGWDDKRLVEARIVDVLNEVGLQDKKHKMPHQLSGGEQQRVVIARALVNYPEIILADEPTGNLDPNSSTEIMNLLLRISRSGTAVVMATHDYKMIEKFPSRIIKCEGSRIVEDHYQDIR